MTSLTDCTSLLSPTVTTSLTWVDTTASGTLPRLDKSGAPGYTWGGPVLGGAMITPSDVLTSTPASTDKLSVSRGAPFSSRLATVHGAAVVAGKGLDSVAGLSVRGPSLGGKCSRPPSGWAPPGLDDAQPVALSFGEDLEVSCTMSLGEDDLKTACTSWANGPPQEYGLWPVALPANYSSPYAAPTHVGTLGSSNPWKYWQWTPISSPVSYPPAALSWDEGRRTCSNVPATLSIEFLWTYVGESSNPQSKILAVRYKYLTDAWSMKREDASRLVTKQTFTFQTVVTWVQHPSSLKSSTYYASAPAILPSLPSGKCCVLVFCFFFCRARLCPPPPSLSHTHKHTLTFYTTHSNLHRSLVPVFELLLKQALYLALLCSPSSRSLSLCPRSR